MSECCKVRFWPCLWELMSAVCRCPAAKNAAEPFQHLLILCVIAGFRDATGKICEAPEGRQEEYQFHKNSCCNNDQEFVSHAM